MFSFKLEWFRCKRGLKIDVVIFYERSVGVLLGQN